MKQLLFISLMLVRVAYGQQMYSPVTIHSDGTLTVDTTVKLPVVADTTRTDTVMLKIILSNKTSVHFYRKGLKRGDQYWYFDGRRIKKLPGNWFVWEWKRIKQ